MSCRTAALSLCQKGHHSKNWRPYPGKKRNWRPLIPSTQPKCPGARTSDAQYLVLNWRYTLEDIALQGIFSKNGAPKIADGGRARPSHPSRKVSPERKVFQFFSQYLFAGPRRGAFQGVEMIVFLLLMMLKSLDFEHFSVMQTCSFMMMSCLPWQVFPCVAPFWNWFANNYLQEKVPVPVGIFAYVFSGFSWRKCSSKEENDYSSSIIFL